MDRSRKILGLLLILLLAVIAREYLSSLRTKIVSGVADRRKDLRHVSDVDLLGWILPRRSRHISYRIVPFNRYYEAVFRIEEENFQEWIEEIQGGEVTVQDADEKLALEQETSVGLVEIPTPEGIEFQMHIVDNGTVHISDGFWLPQITTSKFRLFSASFDAERKTAYVYFFR